VVGTNADIRETIGYGGASHNVAVSLQFVVGSQRETCHKIDLTAVQRWDQIIGLLNVNEFQLGNLGRAFPVARVGLELGAAGRSMLTSLNGPVH